MNWNFNQEDIDDDGEGDACDNDLDNDGKFLKKNTSNTHIYTIMWSLQMLVYKLVYVPISWRLTDIFYYYIRFILKTSNIIILFYFELKIFTHFFIILKNY